MKKKVLIITPNGHMGGTEQFIFNLTKLLKEKDFKVDIMLYRSWEEAFIEKFNLVGNKIIFMPYYLKRPLSFLRELAAFYKNNFKYDYVYCHANHALAILYTYPIWSKKEIKIYFHSHNSTGNHKLLQKIFSKIIVQRSNLLVACSKNAGIYMYGAKSKFIIVNNGVDLSKYKFSLDIRNEIRSKYEIKNNEILLGHVGAFREQKNHSFLIDILNDLLKYNSKIKLMLVGDGELKSEIQNKIEDEDIAEYVIFTGNVKNPEVLYQAFDVFLLPSLYEGLPFVGIEAQASGTSCLVADTVTKELRITPLIHFLPIDAGSIVWSEYIYNNIEDLTIKRDYISLLEQAGYGVKDLEKFVIDNFR